MDLPSLQIKIAKRMPLTPQEEYFVMKSTDRNGVPSQRKFTGLREYPQSVIDNLED